MLLLLFLELTLLFLSNVAALNITVQSGTIVGQPSLVMWSRVPSHGDGLLVFDLRFVNPDNNEDKGLALANIQAAPSAEYGTAQVVFQSPGSYLLVAVSGPSYTWIGQSSQVNAFQVTTTSIPTSTSQPVPSATKSAKSTSTSSGARPKKNLGAIIGGTLGGVAFLALVAALGIVFLRRRRQPEPTKDNHNTRRWTFNRDNMIRPPVLDIRRTTPLNTEFFSPGDIEQQGLPHDDDDIVPTSESPVAVMMASPSGPRPLLKSPHLSIPLPPLLKPHQEDIVAQMEQIRNKMIELEKNPGPAQHIILDDLQKQMNWLKSSILK